MSDAPPSKMPMVGAVLAVTAVVVCSGVVMMVGVMAAIAIPNFITMQLKAKRGEIPGNVDGIKTAELAYDAAFDGYVAVPPAPGPVGSEGKALWDWRGSPEWTTLNWQPDGKVRGVYWVTVSPNNSDFVVHGVADVDGDGAEVHYTATTSINATLAPGEYNVY